MADRRKVALITTLSTFAVLLLAGTLGLYLLLKPAAVASDLQPPAGMQVDGAVQPVSGDDPERNCAMFQNWVGFAVDEAAVKNTGRPYRILRPGDPATMDYSAERINVQIDEQGIVLQVTCG